MVQIVSNFTSYNHDIHERASSELFLHLIILFIVHYLFVFFNVSIHYLSVCPSVHSSTHPFICTSVLLFTYHSSIDPSALSSIIYHLCLPFDRLPIHLLIYPFIYLSVVYSLSIHPFVSSPVQSSVCPSSIHLPILSTSLI